MEHRSKETKLPQKEISRNGTRLKLESSTKSSRMCEFVWEGGGERGGVSTHKQHMGYTKDGYNYI